MEFVVAGLVFVAWYLWLRATEALDTAREAAATIDILQARLCVAEERLDELVRRGVAATAGVAASAGSAPEAAPEIEPEIEPSATPVTEARPAPPPQPAAPTWPSPPIAPEIRRAGAAPAWGAALAGQPAVARATELAKPQGGEPGTEWIPFESSPAEPAGPGVTDRLLARLGLVRPEPGAGWSLAAVQEWLEGRLLAVVGGVAVFLGMAFLLSLAFSRGWITEPMRVAIGLIVGVALMVAGELSFSRLRGILGHVLVAVGLATLEIAFLAGARLYGLVPVEWALLGAFIAAIAAGVIAVRHDSQLVAAYGLVTVLAAPPVLGASPTLVTLLFVAATLIGTTGIALFRTWLWLPPIAFVLAGPQVASYVAGTPPVAEGLIAVAGFWLVNLVASGGEEMRHRSEVLRPTTVTLLLANAAFTLWAGFMVLTGELEMWRGLFAFVLGMAHLAAGVLLMARFGDRHPFGLLVAASGVAAIAMSVPVRYGGPPVPIAWAVEAAALAVLRRHPYSAAVSTLLGGLAILHLVVFEYDPLRFAGWAAPAIPFTGPEGLTLGVILGGLLVAGIVTRIVWVRAWLAAIAGLLVAYALPFELSDTALVAGWAALGAAGIIAFHHLVAPNLAAEFREDRTPGLHLPPLVAEPADAVIGGLSGLARPAALATFLLAWAAAIGHLVLLEYPAWNTAGYARDLPFVGTQGLAFALVLAGLTVVAALVGVAWVRVALAALAGLLAAWVLPFELSGPALVWAWGVLASLAFVLDAEVVEPHDRTATAGIGEESSVWRVTRPAVRLVGGLVALLMIGHVIGLDFPIDRLGPSTILSPAPFIGPEGASLLAILLALAVAGLVMARPWIRLAVTGIALSLVIYAVGFEIPRPHVVVAWALLAAAGIAVARRIARVDLLGPGRHQPIPWLGARAPFAAAALAVLFMIDQSLGLADPIELDAHLRNDIALQGLPFDSEPTYVIGVLALGLLALGATWDGARFLVRGGIAAALAIAWLVAFEVRPGYTAAVWLALAVTAIWLIRAKAPDGLLLGTFAAGLGLLAAVLVVGVVAPPDRLIVDPRTVIPGWLLLTDATVGVGALALAFWLAARLLPAHPYARRALLASGVSVVYLFSVGVVDWFQQQVPAGALPVLDLEWQAQVALDILWGVLGGLGFAAGVIAARANIRLFGLVLFALAAAKLFVIDLPGLPVEGRVVGLIGLGVLLLLAAFLNARLQHPHQPFAPGT